MIWTRWSALAGRKDMVGLQFAFRLALKSCSLQPAGLQKPFSKYLSSHLGFICMLGFSTNAHNGFTNFTNYKTRYRISHRLMCN